jgi:twinkle protein
MYDISGSAHWYNKPDNGLIVYRDKSKPEAPVEVHVQKIRERDTGEVGQVDFRYNKVLADYEEVQQHDRWSAA